MQEINITLLKTKKVIVNRKITKKKKIFKPKGNTLGCSYKKTKTSNLCEILEKSEDITSNYHEEDLLEFKELKAVR